jgi:N-acetylglucosaminyldiphosphoundecaprenol N-acetyl-beta-D-mannosaminyltransferase
MTTTTLVKQNVLGVGITPTSYEEVVRACKEWCTAAETAASRQESARYITVTSVHGIISAVSDARFSKTLNQAAIATPDGMPVVWALRSFGHRQQQRVYGPDLTLALCEMAAREKIGIFLYGSSQATLNRLEENLSRRFPELQITGSFSPPFRPLTEEESVAVVERIRRSGARLIFIGLSTPKQERWMSAHRNRLPGMVLVGVGAAFDFHAGVLRQAPPWMQRSGLEWAFRLSAEPRRLWKRYLLITPLFLPLWALQKIGILRWFGRFAAPMPEGSSQTP